MHVIMSSSESGLEASDVELSKAGILADAILRCTIGKNNDGVYITGEGLITDPKNKKAEFIIDKEPYTLQFYDDSYCVRERPLSAIKLFPFHIDLEATHKKTDK